MAGVLALIGGLIFLFLIIFVVLYVLASLGLYKLAQNRGIENPWLAWIPIADMYILGKLVGSVKIFQWEVPKLELVLPIATLVNAFLNRVPVLSTIISLAVYILIAFVLYKLYSLYRPTNATLWLILGIILPFLVPIFLFIMRNDKLVEPKQT